MKCLTIKLWLIISDYYVEYILLTHYALLDECNSVFVFDNSICLYFYPFIEVVCDSKQHFFFFLCGVDWKWFDCVHPPLCEWPRVGNKGKVWKSWNWSIFMAFITFSFVSLCICFHSGLIVYLGMRLESQCSFLKVIVTHSLM